MSDPNNRAANLIGHGGMNDRDLDGLQEHTYDPARMWLSAKGDAPAWLEFDLGEEQTLGTICIWNYNDAWHTDRGARTADIAVWTEESGWRKLHDDLPLTQAQGTDDYDEPEVITLDAVRAQKVRFEDLTAFAQDEPVGLSKVQFFKPRGPEAAGPYPTDGAEGIGNSGLALQWQPGLKAVAHQVYFGREPAQLKLLGETSDVAEARLSQLAPDTAYHWRIDEVQADGGTVAGKVWSFRTGGLVGWWKLDEAQGASAADAAGSYGAALVGEPVWRSTEGKVGGALAFDGVDDSLAIPALNLYSNTVTITAWVRRQGDQAPWAGIVHCRSERTVAGVNLGDNNEIRYHWNDRHFDWRNSAFTIPDDQWTFVALVVEPDKATCYLNDGAMKVETIPGAHDPEEFDAVTSVGWDRYSATERHFKGLIDDVRIYRCALGKADIEAICSGRPFAAGAEVTLMAPERKEADGDRLIAWWKLDETEGGEVADASGHNRRGMVMGDPQWQPTGGKVGGALALDGDGDFVEIGSESAFDLTEAVTVAVWVKVNRFDKEWQALVTKGNTAWRLARTSTEDTLCFHCNGLEQTQGRWGNGIEGKKNINDGEWHHAVAVYDGAVISLYADGALDNSSPTSGRIQTNDCPVMIGSNGEEKEREWNGLVDEVCIFNYALDANEVAALYADNDAVAVAKPGAAPAPATVAAVTPELQPQPVALADTAEPPTPQGGNRNWIAVIVVIAIVGLIAGISALGKKKASA